MKKKGISAKGRVENSDRGKEEKKGDRSMAHLNFHACRKKSGTRTKKRKLWVAGEKKGKKKCRDPAAGENHREKIRKTAPKSWGQKEKGSRKR